MTMASETRRVRSGVIYLASIACRGSSTNWGGASADVDAHGAIRQLTDIRSFGIKMVRGRSGTDGADIGRSAQLKNTIKLNAQPTTVRLRTHYAIARLGFTGP